MYTGGPVVSRYVPYVYKGLRMHLELSVHHLSGARAPPIYMQAPPGCGTVYYPIWYRYTIRFDIGVYHVYISRCI